jgi:polysaccharide biosynthesis protein PelA
MDIVAAGKPLRRTILQAFVALAVATCRPAPGWLAAKAQSAQGVKWIAYYGETADEQVLSTYDLVVLDPMFKGSKDAITRSGARLCGYLSLGEIRNSDSFYDRLDPAALLEENPAWPNTRRIDIRHRSWSKLLLEKIIPTIAAKGFTGLLLDTLDTPPWLEGQDPIGNRGMRQAAVDLVHAIRRACPDMLLVMNRGYGLLPDLAASLDGMVAESLLTTTVAGDRSSYRWNSELEIAEHLSLLAMLQERRDRLPILSLDYWAPQDISTISEIYTRERALGHHPYVATQLLDSIIPAPAVARYAATVSTFSRIHGAIS